MLDLAEEYRRIFKQELDRISGNDIITGFAVSGPGYIPGPDGKYEPGWTLMLTLKNGETLEDDAGVGIPAVGLVLPEEIVRQGARMLLDEARRIRDTASAPLPEKAESAAGFKATSVGFAEIP